MQSRVHSYGRDPNDAIRILFKQLFEPPDYRVIEAGNGCNGRHSIALPDLRGYEPKPGSRYVIAVEGLAQTQAWYL